MGDAFAVHQYNGVSEEKLARMRELVHFYLKVDFTAIAAIAAAASYFKIEGDDLIRLGAEYRRLASVLLLLIFWGFVLDLGIFRARLGLEKPMFAGRTLQGLMFLVQLQAVWHVLLMAACMGYIVDVLKDAGA